MNIDYQLFFLINKFAGHFSWLDKFTIFFSDNAGYIAIAVLFIITAVKYKNIKNNFLILILYPLLSAAISRIVIAGAIRLIYFRPRPFLTHAVNQLINHSSNEGSFPSGHASFYFALATAIYLTNKKLGIIYFIIAILMGLSRIFTGIHYPLDILAGAIIGIFTAIIIYKIKK